MQPDPLSTKTKLSRSIATIANPQSLLQKLPYFAERLERFPETVSDVFRGKFQSETYTEISNLI